MILQKSLKKKQLLMTFGLLVILPFTIYLVFQTVVLNQRASGESVFLKIVPGAGQFNVGREFQSVIKIEPSGGKKVVIATAVLNYDSDLVEVVDIQGSDLFGMEMELKAYPDQGEIIIRQGVSGSQQPVGGEIDFATINFKVLAPASNLVIDFNKDKTKIVNVQADYMVPRYKSAGYQLVDQQTEPTNTPDSRTGGPEATSTPTEDWPVLNFKVKLTGTSFQVSGEEKTIKNIPNLKFNIRVISQNNNINKTYNDVLVIFDDQAVGIGQANLVGVDPGDNYAVNLKGPIHVGKRFCRDNQTESCTTEEFELSLSNGLNYFNWVGFPLLPGDINQDGRVDSLDFSRLKTNLGKRNQNLPVDLNYNRVVNTQDIILLLNTLNTAYEDEK
jgi:hypothetical protein